MKTKCVDSAKGYMPKVDNTKEEILDCVGRNVSITKDFVIQIYVGVHLFFLIWSPVLFKKGLRSFQLLVHILKAIKIRQLEILTKQILDTLVVF